MSGARKGGRSTEPPDAKFIVPCVEPINKNFLYEKGKNKMKKSLALLLALVMIFALAVPVMADNDTTANTTGTITIENAIKGQTYTIYRVADLESYNAETGAYSYVYNTKYYEFFAMPAVSGEKGYVTIDEGSNKYITWNEGADPQAFANDFLLHFVNTGLGANIGNEGQKVAEGSTVVFDNLPLGYYVIDSTTGALCALTTTNPNAVAKEKNSAPTLEKQVYDTATKTWESATSAFPGEVTFKITITVGDGAQKYIIHDRMDAGLEFDQIASFQINGKDVINGWSLVSERDDKCAFEIVFNDDFYANNELKAGDKMVVEYTAIFTGCGDEATNYAYLAYGDGQKTPEDNAKVKNFDLIMLKWDGRYEQTAANLNNATLFTAQFKLTDAAGNVISFVKPSDEEMNACWFEEGGSIETLRYRVWNSMKDDLDSKTDIIAAGLSEIQGLKAGTYYLEEIAAPDGFNKLGEKLTVVVSEDGQVTINGAAPTFKLDSESEEAETFVIVNNTGAELPSTGGIGTTVFYIVGGLLMVGAAVVLVARKKAGSED